MKYLALVAACLLTIGLASPATADETPDPVQVTFPDVTVLNPDHTPYVIDVHDPEPERGDLVAFWNDQRLTLPHEGSATVPLTAADAPAVAIKVYRCPSEGDGTCTYTGAGEVVILVTGIFPSLDTTVDTLGPASLLPVMVSTTYLDTDRAVQLEWSVTDTRTGAVVTTGSSDWVPNDPRPAIGIPAGTPTTSARVAVHVVSDTEEFGRLEGATERVYAIDARPPLMETELEGDVVFPARDGYLDAITLRVKRQSDLNRLLVEAIDRDGVARTIYNGWAPRNDPIELDGHVGRRKELPAGRYTLRLTGFDEVGNATPTSDEYSIRVDDRRRVKKTFHKTIPASRTLADSYVGACSHLGSAAGRGWKGSLGLYSGAPCAKKNGSVVLTLHGLRLPASVDGEYPDWIQFSMFGGAARGARSAYVVSGWRDARDDSFLGRRQFDGKLGRHTIYTPSSQEVVRNIDGRAWIFWQLGLAAGSRYDVKSFTIRTTYYVLERPASRTASDANTIAEPKGAPGPGYRVPKTDAAELLAAYSPAI